MGCGFPYGYWWVWLGCLVLELCCWWSLGSLCLNCLLLFEVDCGCLWLGFAEVFGYAVVWGWYLWVLGLRLVWVCGFACDLICGWFEFGACWWSG